MVLVERLSPKYPAQPCPALPELQALVLAPRWMAAYNSLITQTHTGRVPMARRCGECRWWEKDSLRSDGRSLEWGVCKAEPPQFAPRKIARNLLNKRSGVWPETTAEDSCGRFEYRRGKRSPDFLNDMARMNQRCSLCGEECPPDDCILPSTGRYVAACSHRCAQVLLLMDMTLALHEHKEAVEKEHHELRSIQTALLDIHETLLDIHNTLIDHSLTSSP